MSDNTDMLIEYLISRSELNLYEMPKIAMTFEESMDYILKLKTSPQTYWERRTQHLNKCFDKLMKNGESS